MYDSRVPVHELCDGDFPEFFHGLWNIVGGLGPYHRRWFMYSVLLFV